MTRKLGIFITLCWIFPFAIGCQKLAWAGTSCAVVLPVEASQFIESQFRGWRIVTIADLGPDEQRLWKGKFGSRCPGVARGHFGPNSAASYAVTLVRNEGRDMYQTLVLLAKVRKGYHMVTLSRAQHSAVTSVVLRLPPGQYSDTEGSKSIRAKFDVISYEVIEAGAIVYYWDGRSYKNLQTSE